MRVYKRKWKDKDGRKRESKEWWYDFYFEGWRHREKGTPNRRETESLGYEKLKALKEGRLGVEQKTKTKFDELAEDFLTDYRVNKKRTLYKAQHCVKLLLGEFGGKEAAGITTPRIKTYVQKRMKEKASNGTINRELAALKRMFNLAVRSTPPKVTQVPYVPMLKEAPPRKGFFEHSEYLSLLVALPEPLQPVLVFGYRVGWRKEEILNLTWDQVDLVEGTVRIEAGDTKNEEARTIYLDDELKALFREQLAKRKVDCPYVFHREGEKIKYFRKSWKSACAKAGLGDKIFHDLRRTAVRNMVRAGIPERVAMMISGHKTRSVFERYNIVSPDDLRQAAERQAVYLGTIQAQNEFRDLKNFRGVANA